MRKVYTKKTNQADGSTLVETIIVAQNLNHKSLEAKFGIREEGFLDRKEMRELTLSEPKIYRCDSTAIRSLAGVQKNERVFVVRQTEKEDYI